MITVQTVIPVRKIDYFVTWNTNLQIRKFIQCLSFPQKVCWGFSCGGMWGSVLEWEERRVSKYHAVFVLFQKESLFSWLIFEGVSMTPFEMSGTNFPRTRRHIPQGQNPQNQCVFEALKNLEIVLNKSGL